MAATPTPSATPTPAATPDPSAPAADDPAIQADIARSTVLAREQGERVEVLSERTESSTTWANVNGSFTTSTFDGPIRIKDADAADGWRDLDYDLVKQDDGSYAPKSGYVPLELSGATTAAESEGNPVVSLTGRDNTDLGFGWDGALPEPTIDGDKATYANVQPNVDLVVQLTAKGFEQSFLLKSKPAAGADVSLELPLIADGVDATEGASGAVALTDSDNKSVGTIPTPYMWDSTGANGSAEPNTAKLPLAVVDQADGTQTVVLTPTQSFLNDPDTKYPVIIDPVIQPYNPAFDTYVQSNMTTTNFSTSTELHVGVQTDGGAVTRSFLNFDAREFQASWVASATLTLYQTQSTTCTATPMTVTASELANANTRWPAQPGNNSSQTATISVSKGYSSACPVGSYGVDVTGLTNFLASQNTPTIGMRLTASETLRSGWKNINSADNTAHKPNLQVTYNRYPGTASTPTVTPITKYDGSAAYANSTTLTFGSSVTDPDGSNTLVRYEVYRTSDTAATNLIGGCDSGGVASGALATCVFHNTFPSSGSYFVRALGQDGGLWSKAWSANTAFNVGIDAPPVPDINCTTLDDDPVKQDGATIPAPYSAAVCAIGVSPEGGASAAVNVRSRVDSGTTVSTNIMPGDGGVFNVTIPNTLGRHVIAASTTNALGITSTAGFAITFADVTPAMPTISCPAPFSNGYTATAMPSSAVVCTITVQNQTFDSSNASIDVFLDNVELDGAQFSDGTSTSTTVSVPAKSGVHIISATADASWGVSSPEADYGFNIPGPSAPTGFSVSPWVPVPDPANPDDPSATNFTPMLSSFSNDLIAQTTTFEIRSAKDATAGSLVQTCVSPSAASGSAATCQTHPLTEGTYYVRSRAADTGATSEWSDWWILPVSALVNTEVMPSATVSCPAIANGQWDLVPPTSPIVCQVTSPPAPSGSGTLKVSLDGQSLAAVTLATSATTTTAVTVPPGAAGHAIDTTVQEVTDGPLSSSPTFTFGSGNWADANLVPNIASGANSDSLTPTLWTQTDGAPLADGTTRVFTVSANSDGSNPILVSTASDQPLDISAGTLEVGVTYYWNAKVHGPNNAGGGISTRTSPWWSFVLTDEPVVESTPAVSAKQLTASAAVNPRCRPIILLTLRGTGADKGHSPDHDPYIYGKSSQTGDPQEKEGYGNKNTPLMGLVTAIRKTTDLNVYTEAIVYDAAGGLSYPDSVARGRVNLIKEINVLGDQCIHSRIWIAGYSQGAHSVGQMLGDDHFHEVHGPARSRIKGVVLMGDPTYMNNEKIDANPNLEWEGWFGTWRTRYSMDGTRAVKVGEKKAKLDVRSYCRFGDEFCQSELGAEAENIHSTYGDPAGSAAMIKFLKPFGIDTTP